MTTLRVTVTSMHYSSVCTLHSTHTNNFRISISKQQARRAVAYATRTQAPYTPYTESGMISFFSLYFSLEDMG